MVVNTDEEIVCCVLIYGVLCNGTSTCIKGYLFLIIEIYVEGILQPLFYTTNCFWHKLPFMLGASLHL